MPLIVRFLLWLVCTALTVTAVFLAIGFVQWSTTPMPPVAHAAPTVYDTSVSQAPQVDAQAPESVAASAAASPGAVPSATSSRLPSPAVSRSTSAAPGTGRPSMTVTAPAAGCQGGAGTHTVRSQGGQAAVRFGASAVCLVSAVPSPDFTTSVAQSSPGTLVVTFTAAGHRSTITAVISPQPQASVRETAL